MPPQHRKAQLGWSHGDLGFNVGQVAPTCLGTPYLEIAAISRALARTIPKDRSNSCSGSPRLTTAYKTDVPPSQIKDEIRHGRRARNSLRRIWKLDPQRAHPDYTTPLFRL